MGVVEQVGGDHYRAEYQHWDWADETNLPYLEGCATKYLTRWREKGGVVDLRKAQSYLEKAWKTPWRPSCGGRQGLSNALRMKFIESARIPEAEAAIIRAIDHGSTDALTLLQRLIDGAEHEAA